MKRSSLTSAILSVTLATASVTSFAEPIITEQQKREQRQTESLTTGTGMIIGGILGGPLGAFATGMLAGLFTKTYQDKQNLAQASEQHEQQLQTIAQYQQKMQALDHQYQQELLALQQSYQKAGQLQLQNLLLSLQFNTGQSDIPDYYQPQLDALASLLKQSENWQVQLSGYTDLQGDIKTNQRLSEQRVAAVKQALINRGLSAEQLVTFAYGESSPVVATKDKPISFYDRRVMIKLIPKNSQTAAN